MGIETYNTRNVGTGLTLAPGMGALVINDGNGGKNYTIALVDSTNGAINPAPLTVAAVGNTKTYDGATSASVAPVITSGSLFGGDTFTTLAESYAGPNAGTGLTLIPTALIDDGNGGKNYTLTLVNNADGTIGKAALLLIPNAASVPYTGVFDGTAYSDTFSNYTVAGLEGGDTLASLGLSLTGSMVFGGGLTVQEPGTYVFGAGTLASLLSNGHYTIAFANPAGHALTILPGLNPGLTKAATVAASDASVLGSQMNAAAQQFPPPAPNCLISLDGGAVKLPPGLSEDGQEARKDACGGTR